jgi:hypothetical protein
MRNFLTADDLANDIKMSRSLHSGAFLIVEGPTDIDLYEKFTDNSHCDLRPAFSKGNAIKALELLEADNFDGIVAIVDRDFWKIDGDDPGNPNLLSTDTHDHESMLISSNALDKVLHDFGDHMKINSIPRSIRDILLEGALPIGLLRWLSFHKIHAANLKFKGLSFHRFIDKRSLAINIGNLIDEIKNNSIRFELDEEKIKSKIEELMKAGYDPWQVCLGCDMIEILSIGLRHVFGKRSARSMTPELLVGILRVAYDDACFCLTEVFKSVKEWEKAKPSFKVLK